MKTMVNKFFILAIVLVAMLNISCSKGSDGPLDPVDPNNPPGIVYPAAFKVTVYFDCPANATVIGSVITLDNLTTKIGKMNQKDDASLFVSIDFAGEEVKNYWMVPTELNMLVLIKNSSGILKKLYTKTITVNAVDYKIQSVAMGW